MINIIVSGSISGIVAIVAAVLTVRLTYKSEAKRTIMEKRMELYFDFYDHVERVLKNNRNILEDEYLNGLIKFKPKMKLLASKSTFNAFQNFYEFVRKQVHMYRDFYNACDPDSFENRIWFSELNESEQHVEYEKFDHEIREYMKNNLPDSDEINIYIIPLYNAMRKDLHIKKIKEKI